MSKHERVEDENEEKNVEKRIHTHSTEPFYDINGQAYWELGGRTRRLSISRWRGQVLIDLREYYEETATGQMKPGKKGLSLTQKQFEYLIKILPEVDAILKNMNKDVLNDSNEKKIYKNNK
ncbi:hypothetical protein PNEG_01922 [Pneumocystis murina B123]|uniref:Transcriptional coactivator p15 (PC4) C-terminal domain-containing protein n=1 Tax=Pneumocystis murina (strain B123) TaxID=1069680 RepID=M7NR58_PNEMU|nr:hypothetical protein PNEG_01922 [Pneumocystis murina B123]EMR09737.1 hypothetical protein PNEG_01922 [Pneumocystis murina B123]